VRLNSVIEEKSTVLLGKQFQILTTRSVSSLVLGQLVASFPGSRLCPLLTLSTSRSSPMTNWANCQCQQWSVSLVTARDVSCSRNRCISAIHSNPFSWVRQQEVPLAINVQYKTRKTKRTKDRPTVARK